MTFSRTFSKPAIQRVEPSTVGIRQTMTPTGRTQPTAIRLCKRVFHLGSSIGANSQWSVLAFVYTFV
jgi:hypothetical protein